MRRLILYQLAILIFAACIVSPDVALAQNPQRPLLVIPGLYQSRLRNDEGTIIFGDNYSLSLQNIKYRGSSDTIRSAGVSKEVKFILPYLTADVAGNYLATLSKHGYVEGVTLFIFDYDWRLSSQENAKKLNEILTTHPILSSRVFDIMGIDQGGIIAEVLLKDGRYTRAANRVHALVEVAVPRLGTVNGMRLLSDGFGNRILNNFISIEQLRDTYISFPAFFEWLPRYRGCCFSGDPSSLTASPLDLLSDTAWADLSWLLPCDFQTIDNQYLMDKLKQARNTFDIVQRAFPENTSIITVQSRSYETRASVYVDTKKKSTIFLTGEGDDVVPFLSSSLSGNTIRVLSAGDHKTLLDNGTVSEIIDILSNSKPTFSSQTPLRQIVYTEIKSQVEPPIAVVGSPMKLALSLQVPPELEGSTMVSAQVDNLSKIILEKSVSKDDNLLHFGAMITAPLQPGTHGVTFTISSNGANALSYGVDLPVIKAADLEKISGSKSIDWQLLAKSVIRLRVGGEAEIDYPGEGRKIVKVPEEAGVGVIIGSRGMSITAQHVVGTESKWKRDDLSKVVGRKIFVDMYEGGEPRSLRKPIERGVQFPLGSTELGGIDVARFFLSEPGENRAVGGVNWCPVKPNSDVVALIWRAGTNRPDPRWGKAKAPSQNHPDLESVHFDEPLERGDSGSPLFDEKGMLVGIITDMQNDDHHYGLFLPVRQLSTVLTDFPLSSNCQ